MNAPITIKVGITVATRSASRWKETTTSTETWQLNTDLDTFASAIEQLLSGVQSYITPLRGPGTTTRAHYSVRLENITAPTPAAGSWVQAKEHFDGALTDEQMGDIDILRTTLLQTVGIVRTHSKY